MTLSVQQTATRLWLCRLVRMFCLVEESNTSITRETCATMVGIDVVAAAGFGTLLNHVLTLVSAELVLICTELVRENRDRYFEAADLVDKRAIVVDIVSSILDKGRFLKHGNNDWEIIPRDKALVKTAQAIQYSMRKKNDCLSDVRTMMESKAEQHLPVPKRSWSFIVGGWNGPMSYFGSASAQMRADCFQRTWLRLFP
jgi:hypothetical protein